MPPLKNNLVVSDNQNNKATPQILVFTPHYAPDFGPSAPIYSSLCEDLAKMGYEVTVITSVPHYAQAAELYKGYSKRVTREVRNGVNLIRVQVISVSKKALWRRLVYHASFNINATFAAFTVKKPDVILGDSPTLWSGLPLLLHAIWRRVPYIYIVFDIYPDVLEKLGVLHSTFFSSLMRKIEQFYYQKGQWITVLSNGFKKNLSQYEVDSEKIRVIPICADLDFMRPMANENHYKSDWKLEKKFVVLYSGNIGYSQGLEFVLDAAKQLITNLQIQFVIVGTGATLASLKNKAVVDLLTNVQFHDFLPYEELPSLYAISDVCLVSMRPELVVESVPSKTYTIMACGRPVIATVDSDSEVGQLITKAQCGLCVSPGNTKSLVNAILQLYSNKALQSQMAINSRIYAEKFLSRTFYADEYQKLIRACLDSRS